MAIDNTFNFNITRAGLIQRSMQLIGALGVGETPSVDDAAFVSDILNSMFKAWDAQGLHQWKYFPGTLLLQQGQNHYTLGVNSTDSNASETVLYTTVTNALAIGVSSVVVASVTGITVNDTIGIAQDNGVMLYTTISAINTGTLTLTLAASTTSTVAAQNAVFTYTSKVQKALDIVNVNRMDTSGTEIPMYEDNSDDYFNLPQKSSQGVPLQYYFQPDINFCDIYVWPTPQTVNDISTRINYRYSKQISDLLIDSDYPDMPQEWYLAIIYNLAIQIAPAYGRLQELQIIAPTANAHFQSILAWDAEHTGFSISPTGKR